MVKIDDIWFTVEEINAETYAISEYGHWEKVHSFLLLGDKRAVLIDTGLGIDNIRRITKQLTSLPITVLTTHVHWDHIGGHEQFDDIYVHRDEVDWLVHGIPKLSIDQIRKDVGRDITLPTPHTFDPINYKPFQGQPSGVLEDGDIIDIGNRKLTVLHTPGHSPGHIALLDSKYGYLFTGDLLYDQAPIYAFFPTTSPEDLVHSLERIAQLTSVTKIFGSHHTVGLDPAILLEIKKAVITLRENNLVQFGTGIHRFKGFSIQF
ncbi:MBL fold metallo-hydrolase [Lysinibacillus cavernae]|uniref:MBL fold metallo-hydrolase n=1 Tax=Lysinibacillus cavernae TaxID=2666135 RepID=UPI0012D8AAE9|nr:MBL fold metallo-hydrolase [Lysinibacillus cavernae]